MRATGGVAFLEFPFLFGGTFIEDIDGGDIEFLRTAFPFLFGGTFIEDFDDYVSGVDVGISLPFRRDFH